MELGPGQPHDMDAIDAMAATATENAGQADQMWSDLQEGFMRSGGAGRTGNFASGALAGRATPATSTGVATRAIP